MDLRKHLDTRDVLRYTPARFLAGYDYMGQCPFLDISLEWEGDRNLQRKRSHVTDDLINLVEAIGTAGAADRTLLDYAAPDAGSPEFLPDDARALFDKPVVAVHPGVGNAMRQWPAEHFASLIDLLVERNGGQRGADRRRGGGRTGGRGARPGVPIAMPWSRWWARRRCASCRELLRACVLYVGNNSGPKHIAAALGVPTIGIHSGVVDADRMGPIGRRAVAVRRNMTCSPCYIARMEDCPRGFACMRGLEPVAVQEVSEILLARPVDRQIVEPMVEPEPPLAAPPEVVKAVPKAEPRRARRRQVSAASAH